MDFVICCQLPFAIVDNPYFVAILNAFDQCYQIPCRQTIRNKVMNRYDNMRVQILEELVKIKKISIICNIWSSITMQLYLEITVHFINKE